MENETQPITVTVKVPFGGDRTVNTYSNITVKELTDTVMATCQPDTFHDIPQCIVQSGRILSESITLREAGVSNAAVLHLMRRPRDGRRIPGRATSSRNRSRRAGSTDDANSGDASDAPQDGAQNDDDHDDDHHHDHEEEHHIHTNVIIGHIAVDGRIRYNDAHDMLLSVLHAVGFSTRAVRSAAAVAAAIAVATQSSEERGGASRAVLRNAWMGTRRLQEQLSRRPTVPSTRSDTPGNERTQDVNADDATPSAQDTTDPEDSSTWRPVKDGAAGTVEEVHVRPTRSTDSAANGTSAVESDSSAGVSTSETPTSASTPAMLPEDPPPAQEGETDLQASERTTDRLLPFFADLLETTASRIRDAPSVVDLDGSDRLESAEILTEQLGSVASASTAVATLVSTLLPDPDDLRTQNRTSRDGSMESAQRSAQTPQGDTSANTGNRSTSSAPNGNTNVQQENRQERISTEEGENSGSNGMSRDSRRRNGPDSENDSRSGTQTFNMFPPGNMSGRSRGASGSSGRIRRSRRVRVSSSQAANADFMIRVLSYYFCSLSDIQASAELGPSEVEGQTAISVLDSLYGNNGTARPLNTVLRLVHFAMQKLTPKQFHEICRGNMVSLAAIRQDLWDEISRYVQRRHGSSVDNEDVEEIFVNCVCEALHEFVHILESADEANEDGVFTPGPEDFCHHIMHIIQRNIEIFADILATRRSETEFSGRLSRWVKGAIGEILLAIAMELEMQWDGLLVSFRRAAHEIGKTVVGSQFSVIFPYIANLFANRAKTAYQRSASRHPDARHSHGERSSGNADTNGETDHSNCGPGCERRQAMLGEGSESRDHGDADDDHGNSSRDGTDSDMPELGEQDSDEDSYDDDDGDDDSDDDANDPMDTDGLTNKARVYDLNDAELRDLARELDSENMGMVAPAAAEDDFEATDLENLASELAAECGASAGKRSMSNSKSKKLPTGPGKRMAAMPAGESTNLPASRVNPILSASGSLPSSAAHRATFSSTSVPRGTGSSSSSALPNDFEKLLGAQDGARWKQVVDHDEILIRQRRYGPLSRGYAGKKSVISALDERMASDAAVEVAKEAAKQAKLSPERGSELERVASENGLQYMKEMERAIGSRLLSDPDFNQRNFPRAARRFLAKES